MDKLFTYLNKSGVTSLTSRIGEFLKKYVGEVYYPDSPRWIADPNVLNSLDRVKLADEFLCEKTHGGKYNIVNPHHVINTFDYFTILHEISIEIDILILRRYFMIKQTMNGVSKDVAKDRSKYVTYDKVPELINKYNHNINTENISHAKNKEKIFTRLATEKQINFIESLCEQSGYLLKFNEQLLLSEAKDIIGFFLEDIALDEEIMKKYLEYDVLV